MCGDQDVYWYQFQNDHQCTKNMSFETRFEIENEICDNKPVIGNCDMPTTKQNDQSQTTGSELSLTYKMFPGFNPVHEMCDCDTTSRRLQKNSNYNYNANVHYDLSQPSKSSSKLYDKGSSTCSCELINDSQMKKYVRYQHESVPNQYESVPNQCESTNKSETIKAIEDGEYYVEDLYNACSPIVKEEEEDTDDIIECMEWLMSVGDFIFTFIGKNYN